MLFGESTGEREAHALLSLAADWGVTTFDCAEMCAAFELPWPFLVVDIGCRGEQLPLDAVIPED